MKTLFLILLFVSPLLADGPKYGYSDAHLNDEMYNIYHDLKYPNAVYSRSRQIVASSGTINSFMVVGTTTNDAAPVGRLGEVISSFQGSTNFVGSTGQYDDVTSIALTAGDWMISGVVTVVINAATITAFQGGIGTVTGNDGTGLATGDTAFDSLPPTVASNTTSIVIPPYEVRLAAGATRYLKVNVVFSAGTPKKAGRITAVRIR